VNTRVTLFCLVALMLGAGDVTRADQGPPKNETGDCGMFALYHLLHLTGRPTELDQIRSALPEPAHGGRSLLELRNAAAKCGLRLDAVVLPKRRSAINGPTLLFVKEPKEGHFLVARPVGHTGTLIQVLDGDREPAVLDADWLFAAPSWTGLALVPRRTNYAVPAAASFSAACLLVLVWRSWTRRAYRAHDRSIAAAPSPVPREGTPAGL
jgi:ABC-type bacteriocin/lantibiotic exporter with double-glycine peptidase domain